MVDGNDGATVRTVCAGTNWSTRPGRVGTPTRLTLTKCVLMYACRAHGAIWQSRRRRSVILPQRVVRLSHRVWHARAARGGQTKRDPRDATPVRWRGVVPKHERAMRRECYALTSAVAGSKATAHIAVRDVAAVAGDAACTHKRIFH